MTAHSLPDSLPCPRGRHGPTRLARVLLTLLSVVAAIWACGAPPTFTHQPGGELTLNVTIRNQFVALDQPNVMVLALLKSTSGGPLWADAQARLTCEGLDVTDHSPDFKARPCPRQPPGGVYHLAYRDGRGATTSMTVPIPTGAIVLLSPRAGDTVPIPTYGELLIRYSLPVPPPGGDASVNGFGVWCGAPGSSTCGLVTSRDSSAASPIEATAAAQERIKEGATLVIGDFQSFQPGPGHIGFTLTTRVPAEQGGFAAATAAFIDEFDAPITWQR